MDHIITDYVSVDFYASQSLIIKLHFHFANDR